MGFFGSYLGAFEGAYLGDGASFVPVPSNPPPGVLLTDEDIWFDLHDGVSANMIVTPSGDWQVVRGQVALAQSLLRRTLTLPGEWKTLPDFGVGLQAYVKQRNTQSLRSEIASVIRAQYLKDTRVSTVTSVVVDTVDDANGSALRVTVFYVARTQLNSPQPTTLIITVR